MFLLDFHRYYHEIYPNDLHLKRELRYYISKYRVISKVLQYIKSSNKKHFKVCDIGGWYGYDDMLLKKLASIYYPDVVIDIDVLDPTTDFYNTVHHLGESDISKQSKINYIEESFLTFDTKASAEQYDIILCCEVIEHLWTSEQEVFFANFNRILKKGGIIGITCPNGSAMFKGLYGIYTRFRKQDHIFEAEFHYRYSHIGVPTVFQVLGLFQRKGFQVHHLYATTPLSSTKATPLSIVLNKIFEACKYINLFFSTDAVYIATKKHALEEKKWYNDSSIVLDTHTELNKKVLQPS